MSDVSETEAHHSVNVVHHSQKENAQITILMVECEVLIILMDNWMDVLTKNTVSMYNICPSRLLLVCLAMRLI